MLLLAVHNILVSKYTGREDIVVGSAIAGRKHADLEKVIGMFVNMLAIRNHPAGDLTFMEFLENVKKNTLEAFKNQDYPFEELIRELNLHGDPSGNLLFDTACQLADIPLPEIDIPGLRLIPFRQEPGAARFDLIINGRENKERNTIDMMISYSTELFKPSTAEKIARNFREILKQIVKNRHIKLEDISISIDLLDARTGVFKESQHEFGF
jgi:non-ribosomal peptide synthetase component F